MKYTDLIFDLYGTLVDIPFEQMMADLFRDKGIDENADTLGFNAAPLIRAM